MTQQWLRQSERGSAVLLRFMAWLALNGGAKAAETLLYPICAYFTVFSGRTRRASLAFFSRVTGRRATLRDVFGHYHTFASTILHRMHFLAGRYSNFDVRIHGAEPLEKLVAEGRGCLLMGAHMGSFEVLRALGVGEKGLSVKMLMHESNARIVNKVLNSINPDVAADIVVIGQPGALLGIDEHLERGGLVALLGDRTVCGEKQILCPFLGGEAKFPVTPMILAGVLKVPVVLAVGLYRGRGRYDVHFEMLTDGIEGKARERDAEVRRLTAYYAERLEHYCRLAPDNWFNFYDFWE